MSARRQGQAAHVSAAAACNKSGACAVCLTPVGPSYVVAAAARQRCSECRWNRRCCWIDAVNQGASAPPPAPPPPPHCYEGRKAYPLSSVLLTLALDVTGPVHALHAAPSGEGSIRRCFCGRRTKISCRRCSCHRQRQARYRQHWGDEANIARARPPLIRRLQPARTSTAPLFYPNSSICCHRTL